MISYLASRIGFGNSISRSRYTTIQLANAGIRTRARKSAVGQKELIQRDSDIDTPHKPMQGAGLRHDCYTTTHAHTDMIIIP